MTSTTKSRKDCDILCDLVGHNDFNMDDIKEMDFHKIKEELRSVQPPFRALLDLLLSP